MKLRNKQTGEIEEFEDITRVFKFIGNQNTYKSLAEFIEEWEDYEEPKDFWFIDPEVLIACESTEPFLCDKKVAIETMKQIGNYFETKEEAEKAVERLRAWKRLKDKGFRFKKWESYEETSGLSFPDNHIVNSYTAIFDFNKPCRKHEIENEVKADLDLLFLQEDD